MKERILKLISQIMEVDVDSLDENSSSDNIDNWDSLRHMNLIVAIEEEFDIELTDEQIVEIKGYKDLFEILG